MSPRLADVAELVRLPAVLTVPGDVLAGSGRGSPAARTAGLAASSSLLYLAGMALNDYADRDLDAVERPERPIPSGRVPARTALSIAVALTGGGVALAGVAGGIPALRVAVPLTGVVWSYDLALKDGRYGVPAMTAARFLDVVLGGAGRSTDATAACLVAAHTALVTVLSRQENRGASRRMVGGTLAGHVAVSVAALGAVWSGARAAGHGVPARAVTVLTGACLAGAYVAGIARGHRTAAVDPSPANVKHAVGGGITALTLLQALLSLRRGRPGPALALATLQPTVRRLARRRTVT